MTLNIRLQDVSVEYRTQPAGKDCVATLSNVNLEIGAGDLVVALGASGCGKTTLLNLLAGFIGPTSGAITLERGEHGFSGGNGFATNIMGPGVERGVVFQKHALMPWLNVRDNVALGLKFRGMPRPEREAVAMDCLRLTGLTEFAAHAVHQLSGGMQQRVGIARAIANDPEMLLMDEPLGALDFVIREQLQVLILDIWSRTGKTIFYITHDIEEALFLGTRLILLSSRPGRIVGEMPLDFGRRYLLSGDAREVKSSVAFIEARERVVRLLDGSTSTYEN